jgi:hypothetical protein
VGWSVLNNPVNLIPTPTVRSFKMKRLLVIPVLLLALFDTNPAWGEWKMVRENFFETDYYVDFDRIRKYEGYVYYWEMIDRRKPVNEALSSIKYSQIDCKIFRYKGLSRTYYTGHKGGGAVSLESHVAQKDWTYPHPTTLRETILKSVCDYVK